MVQDCDKLTPVGIFFISEKLVSTLKTGKKTGLVKRFHCWSVHLYEAMECRRFSCKYIY